MGTFFMVVMLICWALLLLGMLAFTAGVFLSVQPMVQAQIDKLKQKVHDVTTEKSEKKEAEGGGGDA